MSRAPDAFQARIEMEIVDAGWLLKSKEIQDMRRCMAHALDCEFYRKGMSLTLLQSWSTSSAFLGGAGPTTAVFVERMSRATRNVRIVFYGRPSNDVIENGANQLGCDVEVREPIADDFRRPRSGLRFAKDTFKARVEMDVIGDLDEVRAFVNDWQATEREDAGIWDFEFFLSPDNKSVTLLKTVGDHLAQQRHTFRWLLHHADRMSSLLRVAHIHVYGHVSDALKDTKRAARLDQKRRRLGGWPVEYKDRVQGCPSFQR